MESKHNEHTRIIRAKNPTNCERGAYIKEQEREAPLCPPRLSDTVYLRTSKQLRQVPQPTNTHAIGSLCWSPAQLRGGTLPCWTAALVCRVSLPCCAHDGPRELSRALWGPLGGLAGAHWEHFGSLLEASVTLLDCSGASRRSVGALLGCPGVLLDCLEALLGSPGASSRALRGLWAPLGGLFLLGASWGSLGALLGGLRGPSWAVLKRSGSDSKIMLGNGHFPGT